MKLYDFKCRECGGTIIHNFTMECPECGVFAKSSECTIKEIPESAVGYRNSVQPAVAPPVVPPVAPTTLSHYHREIKTLDSIGEPVRKRTFVDVYAILDAFPVEHPIGHAIKKLLDGGNRGAKDKIQDWEEAVMSIQAAIKLEKF